MDIKYFQKAIAKHMIEVAIYLNMKLPIKAGIYISDNLHYVKLKFGADDIPILLLSVTARESMPGLYKILDDKVSNPLARIGGVGTVSVSGVPEREIKVYVDPYKIYISDNLHYVKPKVRYLHLMRCGFARIGRSQKFGFHCWIPPFDWSCQSRFCLFPFVKHLMDYTMAILLKKDGTAFPVA